MKEYKASCATCEQNLLQKVCWVENGKPGKNCPTVNAKDIIEKSREIYEADPALKEFARVASVQEGECYADRDRKPYIPHCVKPRIQEVCEFAKKLGYKRLGMAFCIGMVNEASMLHRVLTAQGFEVISIMCKAGRIDKNEIGVKDDEKIMIDLPEAMCNPVMQALYLNEAGTEFNILLGLCVGHDSIFFKYAKAPTTVLAVKDRVTGHNPLAALYTNTSYYMFMLRPGF
jgi:uncharacterized metal-binding protein